MNSKLDRRGNSIAFDIARYLERRKVRDDSATVEYRNLTESDANDVYREITTVLLEAVGIYLVETENTYIETIETIVSDKGTEKDAIVAILKDFALYLEYGEIPEIATGILRSFRERESEFSKGVYSYDSLGETPRKVG